MNFGTPSCLLKLKRSAYLLNYIAQIYTRSIGTNSSTYLPNNFIITHSSPSTYLLLFTLVKQSIPFWIIVKDFQISCLCTILYSCQFFCVYLCTIRTGVILIPESHMTCAHYLKDIGIYMWQNRRISVRFSYDPFQCVLLQEVCDSSFVRRRQSEMGRRSWRCEDALVQVR